MEFPGDTAVWDESLMTQQYMFGADFLVAPVFTEGATTKGVYFPDYEGCVNWASVWSDDVYECGQTAIVQADLGAIPVFYRSDSEYGPELKAFLGGL